jgi:hypothetical protein
MNGAKFAVKDETGTEYGAASAEGLVKLMRLDTFLPATTNVGFKKTFARRIETAFGKTIRFHDAESFIKELERINYLSILKWS